MAKIGFETYDSIEIGHCNFNHGDIILKIVNSNYSMFNHGHRYTDNILKRNNVFRCSYCTKTINENFVKIKTIKNPIAK